MGKILILEDNKKLAGYYKTILQTGGYEVELTFNSTDFFYMHSNFKPDILILDIKLNNSEMNGLEVFERLIKQKRLFSKVIILSGEATRMQVAKAMKLGAYTFIEKTGEFNTDKFLADVRQAINLKMQEDSNKTLKTEKANLQKELIKQSPLIGESAGIKKVKELIRKFSQAETDILLIGETGTGKEIIADNIYWQSKRAGKPFIKINSGGLTETIVDSELFGHKRGSFTGAISDRRGFFEQANEGILFLDEISNLNYSTQAKILRAIENREIQVVGGPKRVIDVCFIFATNQNLPELVKDKIFREDLYYRLEGNIIDIPSLRERGDDIIILMEHFFNKYSPKYNCYINVELRKLKKDLLSYNWPGNVRELEKFCEYLMIMHDIIDNETILEEFNKKISGKLMKQNETLLHLLKIDDYSKAFDIFDMKYLQFQLLKNNWQVSETAEKIGLDRSTLYKKIKKYKIV